MHINWIKKNIYGGRASPQLLFLPGESFLLYQQAVTAALSKAIALLGQNIVTWHGNQESCFSPAVGNWVTRFLLPPGHCCSVCNPSSFFLLNPVSFCIFIDSQMSGRVCFPSCESLCYAAELVLESLANWGFLYLSLLRSTGEKSPAA